MKIEKIILVSICVFILSVNLVFATNGFFSAWDELRNWFKSKEPQGGLPKWFKEKNTPMALVRWLEMFGIPEEITVNWGAIVFFIIVPMATFSLVIKYVLVDEIIVNTMKISKFSGFGGWLFVFLIVFFLLPSGILGRAAMWLYASAGILTVYGFGALLVIGVLDKFILPYMPGKWYLAPLIITFLGIVFTMLVPWFGIIIGILGVLWTVIGYTRHRSVGILAPERIGARRRAMVESRLTSYLNMFKNKLGETDLQIIQGKIDNLLSIAGELSDDALERKIQEIQKEIREFAKRAEK